MSGKCFVLGLILQGSTSVPKLTKITARCTCNKDKESIYKLASSWLFYEGSRNQSGENYRIMFYRHNFPGSNPQDV